MASDLPCSPASERNREPILAALRPLLADSGLALEIASGTGQHVAHFASALPGWRWQPSDVSDALFGAIAARTQALSNVAAARRLDVLDAVWPSDGDTFDTPFDRPIDLVFSANMLHIAPWACTLGLMRGAARHLKPGAWLVMYGPYLEAGVPAAPGNLAFDAELRSRNPAWGIRTREAVNAQARAAGLAPVHRIAMPANNLLLAFQRD